MNYLLDTHTLIWFLNGDSAMSANARKLIEHKNAKNFVSIVSIWEIAIKISLGKLNIHVPMEQLPVQINNNGFELLPVAFEDTIMISKLPFHHRDPFDRLLIVQSITNNLSLISKDPQFSQYGIKTLW
ncbi:MAG: type II toxin-antitoxin system VapC family toxin [Taibaiella sp.]|nr:type II toxin-antitoxin system VapC family toxin [Taibaiella sp.]